MYSSNLVSYSSNDKHNIGAFGSALMMEWSSFNATEGSEVMEQLLGPYSFTENQGHNPILGSIPSMFDLDPYYLPHVCFGTTSTNGFLSTAESEMCYVGDSNMIELMDLCSVESSPIEDVPNPQFKAPVYLNEETSDPRDHGNSNAQISLLDHNSFPKRKLNASNLDQSISIENPKKKCRVSVKANSNNNNARPMKAQSTEVGGEDENNASLAGQSYSSRNSEKALNASEELNGYDGMSSSSKNTTDQNVNGKIRARRGSAVDPQSLYAKKRRERIGERLRILQNLVPNGTKVDISTMLEEALDYVKFLQLQIKLLSSNDLWMYAPIAYNGMDFGIGATISLPN